MKNSLLAALAALALAALPGPAPAKVIQTGGLTLEDVAAWLKTEDMAANIETTSDGTRNIHTSVDGQSFHIYLYDCKGALCGSLQFSAGFDTKGAFDAVKMNEWDRTKRWARAYVDSVNDPWLEYDVDLTPGGTYELLDDELGTWRQGLSAFRKYIGW